MAKSAQKSIVLDPDHEAEAVAPPTVEEISTVELSEAVQVAVDDPLTPEPDPASPRSLIIELPFADISAQDKGYVKAHIDIQLNGVQAKTLKALMRALHDTHQRTTVGRHVDSVTDAIRWLLDQIAAASLADKPVV